MGIGRSGGKVEVEISAETRQFGSAMVSAGAALTKFVAGMATVGALINRSNDVLDYAGRIKDLSMKLGIGAEQLQKFDAAAAQSGVSIEDVAGALKYLSVSMAQALAGSKAEIAAFQRMGIAIQDIKSKNVVDLFLQIGRVIEKSAGGAQEVADSVQLMGRAGDRVIPAFKDGFIDMANSARVAAAVISNELIDRLDAAGDRVEMFGRKSRVIFAGLVDFFATLGAALHSSTAGIWAGLKQFIANGGGTEGVGKAMLEAGSKVAVDYINLPQTERARRPYLPPELVVPGLEIGGTSGGSSTVSSPGSSGDRYAIPTVDALARIGGFRGGYDASQATRRQLLGELRRVNAQLAALLAQATE